MKPNHGFGSRKASRRKFVALSVISLVGLVPGKSGAKPISIAEQKNASFTDEYKFRTSARLEKLPGKNLPEKVSNAKRYGFDGISLPGRYLKDYVDELENVFYDLPLPLVSLSLGYEGTLLSPDSKIREKCHKSLIDLFDLCNRMKIKSLNMVPVFLEDHPANTENDELDKLLVSQLFEICEEARKRNVFMLLEAVNRYETKYITRISRAVDICRKVNHENLGVTADFYHMMLEELRIGEAIRNAGSLIKHVHVAENTRVEPGPGLLDFKPGFSELRKLGYTGFFEIECRELSGDPEIVYPASIKYLKKIWNSA